MHARKNLVVRTLFAANDEFRHEQMLHSRAVPPDVFAWIEELLQSGNADAAFDGLIERFRRDKQYRLIFDARMLKRRLDLGLPLVSLSTLGDLPDAVRQPYQDAYIHAAREVGDLFLADGDIPGAWTYFRAIGDAKPVI